MWLHALKRRKVGLTIEVPPALNSSIPLAMDVIRPDTAMKVAKAEEGRSVVLTVHDHSKEIKSFVQCVVPLPTLSKKLRS